MTKVSLDPFRSPGVAVFSGYDRGALVGHYMRRMYGYDIEITIPDDIICISDSFQAGMISILGPAGTNLSKAYMKRRSDSS